jgi:uncharacterized protein (TIGR03083 family)
MDEITAFLDALDTTEPDAPTRCAGWTTHDLLAHMVAGTEEMIRLIERAGAGDPDSDTRAFAGREAPWRATPDAELRVAFLTVGGRFVTSLEALPPGTQVAFTGWTMTATELHTHARSELALHRWDLVGDDRTSALLLAQTDLLAHGRAALTRMPTLHEARRPPAPHDDLLTMWGRRALPSGGA